MPRPALATPEQVRSAVLALLSEAGSAERPSAGSFRQAVSVRKVRERLGGGNPATIGRAINALEAELVRAGADRIVLPDVPPPVAELMQQLWQAAVGAQLDEVAKLRSQAQQIAERARSDLTEANLRGQMLHAELTDARAALAERDAQLAQALSEQKRLAAETSELRASLETGQTRLAQLGSEVETARQAQAHAIAQATQRYEGLSQRLLEETAQQRHAGQAEAARLASQLKFADKRAAALEERLLHLEAQLAEARALKDQALGEAAALRYANASLRSDLEALARTLAAAPATRAPGLARGRARPPKGPRGKLAKSAAR